MHKSTIYGSRDDLKNKNYISKRINNLNLY